MPSAVGVHEYSGRDRADGVVVEEARAASRGQVVHVGAAMPWFADHGQQTVGAEELRQQVVLDLPRQPTLAAAVTRGRVDLPVVARHHLVGDARSVEREGSRFEPLWAHSARPKLPGVDAGPTISL